MSAFFSIVSIRKTIDIFREDAYEREFSGKYKINCRVFNPTSVKINEREVKCMKLIEEIYEMYRGRIKGTDEDLDLIALTILEDTSRNEIIELIQEMETEELEYFLRLYIFETLKEKWSKSEERVRLERKSLH